MTFVNELCKTFNYLLMQLSMKLIAESTILPCSCCKGAFTLEEAHFVKEKLTGAHAKPNPKD
jgi:hypothetical protein